MCKLDAEGFVNFEKLEVDLWRMERTFNAHHKYRADLSAKPVTKKYAKNFGENFQVSGWVVVGGGR